jgi:hypothetical protein
MGNYIKGSGYVGNLEYDKDGQIIKENEVITGHTIETTVVAIYDDNKKFAIKCNPQVFDCADANSNYLYLRKSNPRFIEFYNKIQIGKTYKFTYSYKSFPFATRPKILNMEEPNTYNICGIVKGFLNIASEKKNLTTYSEVVVEDSKKNRRLLIDKTKTDHIVIGKVYTIDYVKSFGSNLYYITDCKLCS